MDESLVTDLLEELLEGFGVRIRYEAIKQDEDASKAAEENNAEIFLRSMMRDWLNGISRIGEIMRSIRRSIPGGKVAQRLLPVVAIFKISPRHNIPNGNQRDEWTVLICLTKRSNNGLGLARKKLQSRTS